MVDFWKKGIPVSVTRDHTLDVARTGVLTFSSMPAECRHNIVGALHYANAQDPTTLIVTDDPDFAADHLGSILHCDTPKKIVAATGLAASMAIDRARHKENSFYQEPLWNIVIFVRSIDDVLTDASIAPLFNVYAASLASYGPGNSIHAIFGSTSHKFALSDAGKALLKNSGVVIAGPVQNQTVQHALGFFSSIKETDRVYARGLHYGAHYEIPLAGDGGDTLDYVNDSRRRAEAVMSEPYVRQSVIEAMEYFNGNFNDFVTVLPHDDIRPGYQEELSVPVNTFDPRLYVNRLMLLLGSFPADKTPTLHTVSGHMGLNLDDTRLIVDHADAQNKRAGERIKGFYE